MGNYKTEHGFEIKHRSSDPPSPIAGEIWYNTTTQTLKVAPNIAAWSSGGNLPAARASGMYTGTQTANLLAGGYAPGLSNTSVTYDGSSWTEGANLNVGRAGSGNCGATQTAALFFAGYTPSPAAKVATAEKWNGTSWTEVSDLNTARDSLAGAGTTTAGLAIGGATPGGTVVTVCE